MPGAKRKAAGKGFLDALAKDRERARRFKLSGGTVLETNVKGFDPTALRGMTEADLRAILDKPN